MLYYSYTGKRQDCGVVVWMPVDAAKRGKKSA